MKGGYSNYFLMASLVYFVIGAALGLLMIWSWTGGGWKAWDYYLIPSHVHLMLLGWVSMTMYGMMYRIVPAFFGRRLYSESLAWAHFIIANLATVGMALFFWLHRWQESRWITGLALSGGLQFVGILIFVFNLFASIISGETKLETPRNYAAGGE